MRAEAFKSHLTRTIGERTADSYVSRCRRIEAALGLDLDACDLSETGIANIRSGLQRQMPHTGMTPGSLADCLTAARKYGAFRR